MALSLADDDLGGKKSIASRTSPAQSKQVEKLKRIGGGKLS